MWACARGGRGALPGRSAAAARGGAARSPPPRTERTMKREGCSHHPTHTANPPLGLHAPRHCHGHGRGVAAFHVGGDLGATCRHRQRAAPAVAATGRGRPCGRARGVGPINRRSSCTAARGRRAEGGTASTPGAGPGAMAVGGASGAPPRAAAPRPPSRDTRHTGLQRHAAPLPRGRAPAPRTHPRHLPTAIGHTTQDNRPPPTPAPTARSGRRLWPPPRCPQKQSPPFGWGRPPPAAAAAAPSSGRPWP